MTAKILAHRTFRGPILIEQPLEEHLVHTAQKAAAISESLGLSYAAKTVGYLHDVGKYARIFQEKRLRNGMDISFDHTLAGAQILFRMFQAKHDLRAEGVPAFVYLTIMVNCIISHHIGLPDLSESSPSCPYTKAITESDKKYEVEDAYQWLKTRSFYQDLEYSLDRSYEEITSRLIHSLRKQKEWASSGFIQPTSYNLSCMTRLLSSILHQADAEDTAENRSQFSSNHANPTAVFRRMLAELERDTGAFPQKTEIQRLRSVIFQESLNKKTNSSGCYRLQAPVGSGKTRASMAFALSHAIKANKKRIIYVSPYITIVSQNYESILKATKTVPFSGEMIERDSQVQIPESFLRTSSEEEIRKLQLSVSSLSAPVSFTTTVQFENALLDDSYGSYHTFASLSDAVIIIDEMQTINKKKYHNLILNLNFLAEYMNTTVLVCTATPPELETDLKYRLRYSPNPDLISDPVGMRKKFDRVMVHDITRKIKFNCESLVSYVLRRMNEKEDPNAIVIMNRKKDTEECFRLFAQHPDIHVIRFNANGKMYAKRIIEEINEHLQRSKEGKERFVLVTTSIVEIGVDVSFSVGFRELTTMVSLEQSAGRVNRNQEYGKMADLYIFSMEEVGRYTGQNSEFYEIGLETKLTMIVLSMGHSSSDEVVLPACQFFSKQRYNLFYQKIKEQLGKSSYMNYIDGATGKNLVDMLSMWNLLPKDAKTRKDSDPCGEVLFNSAYTAFQSIETSTKSVLCETAESRPIISALKAGVKFSPFDKKIIRNSIQVHPKKVEKLMDAGLVCEIDSFFLLDPSCMDQYGAVLG